MASLFLIACGTTDPPAVRDASKEFLARPIAPGMGRVILVRTESPCDNVVYPTVVDENGHFLAELSQSSETVVDLPEGDHVLLTWPSMDERDDRYPDYDPVGVAPVRVRQGETSNVVVYIPFRTSNQCWRFATFGLRVARNDDQELLRAVGQARFIVNDRVAGEAELAKDPELVRAHMEAGRRHLERRKQLHDERQRAQKSPDDSAGN